MWREDVDVLNSGFLVRFTPLGVQALLLVRVGLAFQTVERVFYEPDVAAESAFYLVEARFLFFEVVI